MPIHRWRRVVTVACGVWGTCLVGVVAAAPDARPLDLKRPAASPQQPASPLDAPHTLARQLGDDDFRVREAAAKRLKEMGKTALPALRQALGSADPEVCSRADALIRQIEKPRIPSGWFVARNGVRRMQESVINGNRVLEAEESGRTVRITEGPGGLEMTLSGVDDGEVVSFSFRARDAGELRRQEPDAYALYERIGGLRSTTIIRGRRVPFAPVPRAPARLLPLVPPGAMPAPMPAPRPPADDLLQLELRLRIDMRRAGVADVEQQAVLEALRLLREIQTEGQIGLPEDLEAQVRKYNALSDALRKKLDDLNLPGPGDALPPPARARLGISVAPPDPDAEPGQGVIVRMVIPASRGEKIGLLEGDVIRRINGKAVDDAAALRRVLTDEEGAIAIDVVREGKEQTLREKAD